MRRASSTATSSRQTSSSPNAETPRFWTSVWRRGCPSRNSPAPEVFERQQLTDGLGAALGTAAYMSPEQALGKQVDTRTDLFSFGIVLYEMCTGRSPFPGDTTGELLISIVQQVQITPARLNPDVPEGLARIIDRCLEKDRELRYQQAGDIRADLKSLQRNSAELIEAPLAWVANKHRALLQGPGQSRVLHRGGDGNARGPVSPNQSRRAAMAMAISGLLIIAAALLAFLLTRPLPVPKVSNYVQLTHDGQPKALVGTDGSRLYLGFARPTVYNATVGIMQMSSPGASRFGFRLVPERFSL